MKKSATKPFRVRRLDGRVVVRGRVEGGPLTTLATCRRGARQRAVEAALADLNWKNLAVRYQLRGQIRERLRAAGLLEPDLPVRLREAREEAGLSRADVCDALGIGRKSIIRWEIGQVRPSLDRLEQLAALYETRFVIGE